MLVPVYKHFDYLISPILGLSFLLYTEQHTLSVLPSPIREFKIPAAPLGILIPGSLRVEMKLGTP